MSFCMALDLAAKARLPNDCRPGGNPRNREAHRHGWVNKIGIFDLTGIGKLRQGREALPRPSGETMPRAVDESGCRQCAPGLQVLVDKLFICFRMVGDSLSTSPKNGRQDVCEPLAPWSSSNPGVLGRRMGICEPGCFTRAHDLTDSSARWLPPGSRCKTSALARPRTLCGSRRRGAGFPPEQQGGRLGDALASNLRAGRLRVSAGAWRASRSSARAYYATRHALASRTVLPRGP
jgi:hypothetical protein